MVTVAVVRVHLRVPCPIRERVGAVPVRVGRVGEGAVRRQRERPVDGPVQDVSVHRVALDVDVVPEHTGRSDSQWGVFGRRVGREVRRRSRWSARRGPTPGHRRRSCRRRCDTESPKRSSFGPVRRGSVWFAQTTSLRIARRVGRVRTSTRPTCRDAPATMVSSGPSDRDAQGCRLPAVGAASFCLLRPVHASERVEDVDRTGRVVARDIRRGARHDDAVAGDDSHRPPKSVVHGAVGCRELLLLGPRRADR